jgi:hypothetical protein
MITIPVDVTPDHIVNGRPGVCRQCPVALAVERAVRIHLDLPDFSYVEVTGRWIFLCDCNGVPLASVRGPGEVSDFIDAVDAYERDSGCVICGRGPHGLQIHPGWLVYEFEDPAEVPLPHHLFGACYLLPDGGVCLVPRVGGGAA